MSKPRALALAALLALALLDGRAARGEGPSPDGELATARAALAAGDLTAAERLFRQLVTRNPGFTEAYEGLAEALGSQGKAGEATAVWLALGRGWLEGREPARAARYLNRAVELSPADRDARALLGRALVAARAHAEACRHLERALALGDTSTGTRLLLGAALWESGRLDDAERALRTAARTSPQAAHQLARLLLWQGRASDALAVLEPLADALRTLDFELDFAQALEGAGRLDEAITTYRRLAERAPEHSLPPYRLSILLRRQGRATEAAEARSIYERLYREEENRKREQGRAQADLDRCWSLLESAARQEEAVACFRALAPTPAAQLGLARALSAAGRRAEAIALLEQLILREPDRQDLRLLLAEEREAPAP